MGKVEGLIKQDLDEQFGPIPPLDREYCIEEEYMNAFESALINSEYVVDIFQEMEQVDDWDNKNTDDPTYVSMALKGSFKSDCVLAKSKIVLEDTDPESVLTVLYCSKYKLQWDTNVQEFSLHADVSPNLKLYHQVFKGVAMLGIKKSELLAKLLVFPIAGGGYMVYFTSLPNEFLPENPEMKRVEQIIGVTKIERFGEGAVRMTQYAQLDPKLNKTIVALGLPILKRNLATSFNKMRYLATTVCLTTHASKD